MLVCRWTRRPLQALRLWRLRATLTRYPRTRVRSGAAAGVADAARRWSVWDSCGAVGGAGVATRHRAALHDYPARARGTDPTLLSRRQLAGRLHRRAIASPFRHGDPCAGSGRPAETHPAGAAL